MRRLAVPGGLVQKDGLGQSDAPRRYLTRKRGRRPAEEGDAAKAPHGPLVASRPSPQAKRGGVGGSGTRGGRAVGPGGMQRVSSSQIQFWFQEVQGPLCFPGVSKEPLSLLGRHEWIGPVRTFGIDICGRRVCSPSGLSGFTGGAGLELGWPHTGGQFWASPVWVYRPPPGKHRSALPGSQAGMLVPGGRCWVLGVAHL